MSNLSQKIQKTLVACAVLVQLPALHAMGIIGGFENASEPYAAIIDSSGVATKITGEVPVPNGLINSARMNSSGMSFIGGQENSGPVYLAQVSPTGVATKVTGSVPSSAYIFTVDINSSGMGLAGGNQGSLDYYAAMISSSGVATELTTGDVPVNNAVIYGVALNDSGFGIIGGQDNNLTDPYAAIVSSSGVLTAISGGGVPSGAGAITAVAINESGAAIIGGRDGGGNTYASIISPTGAATALSGAGVPTGNGNINSVAINDSGSAIIGGQDQTNVAYAALVNSSGVASSISGFTPAGTGNIISVDINASGAGIIAGRNNTNDAFAALVSPSGDATIVTGDTLPSAPNAQYSAAAINDAGVGILGGADITSGGAFYAALVSPTGVATNITGEIGVTSSTIRTVDIIGALDGALGGVNPSSFGPGNTFADPVTALSANILTSHLRNAPERGQQPQTAALTADASDRIQQPQGQGCQRANYAVWGAPFGLFATYDKGHSFPKLEEWSAGGILGFDYLGWDNVVFGGAAAYSFQHVDYKSQGGHAEIHQELLAIYGAWQGNHISIDGALWGGIYQMHNKRKTLGSINSTSNVDGGIFAPHLRIGAPFKINNTVLTVEPYAMLDWINNWQGSIKESGSAGLNIRMDSHYVSLLRSEVGLGLVQHLHYNSGDLTFEQSGSYVNRAPFNAKKESAYYVGSASTFSVQLFSDRVENLGALRLSGRFVPCNINYPYVAISYLGEFGANLIVNTFALEVGKRF